MPRKSFDLAGIFNTVAQALAANQQTLNQADTYNQDHGDNMTQTFQIIADALQQKKGISASKALAYAANVLAKSTTSSSGRLYAENLTRASAQFKGKSMDAMGALSLLQTLIGGGQANQPGSQPTGGDLLSSLLGNLAGGGQSPNQPSTTPAGNPLDMLISALGGSAGTSPQPTGQSGSGDLLGSLLGGLLGGSGGGLDNLVQGFLGGSGMGDASHRTQSTQLVVNTFLQALGALKK